MKKITKNILSSALLAIVFGLPLVVGAQFDPTAGSATTGLSTSNLDSVLGGAIAKILTVVSLLAVIGFVVSGIMFLTAGGNEDRLKSAKAWLTYSIIGLIVSLIGYIVVKFVSSMIV